MKIPDHAKKVFQGVLFSVWQWEQKMYDGTISTFESLKRQDTVLVIPIIGEKIVFSSQEQPDKSEYYSLLGGRQDTNETTLQTAKRELLEEAGMVAEDMILWKTYEPFSKMDWKINVYVAKNCKTIAKQKLDSGEKITLLYVDFAQFIKLVTSEKYWGGRICPGYFSHEEINAQADGI